MGSNTEVFMISSILDNSYVLEVKYRSHTSDLLENWVYLPSGLYLFFKEKTLNPHTNACCVSKMVQRPIIFLLYYSIEHVMGINLWVFSIL